MTWLKNIIRNYPQGSPFKTTGTGPALTPTVEEGVIPTGMTTGTDNYLPEVEITAGPREKTRKEHRLDKTEAKIADSENTVGGGEKTNRLRRRKQRLENRIARQEQRGKNKKTYARKDKAFWKNR